MKIKKYIDQNFDKALQDIIKIINIKTLKNNPIEKAPFGLELKKGLEETLKIAKKLGFKTKNLDNYIGYAEWGVGDEYIAILGHIDVVPQGDESRWSVPPFKGVIKNNELVARGALDNKGPIISSMYSLKAVLESYPSFNKKIRIIFGTNEESGDEDIKYYLKHEKPPKYAFTPDGRFPVIFSEKGIYTFSFKSKVDVEKSILIELEAGKKSNVVPEISRAKIKLIPKERIEDALTILNRSSKCKFDITYTGDCIDIICMGKAAHASSPQKGINAILGIYKLLNLIFSKDDSMKEFFNFIDKKISDSYRGEGLEIDTVNKETGDLTINAGITKLNFDEIFIKFNIRYPNSVKENFLDSKLSKVTKDTQIIFVKENHNPPLYFEKKHPLVQTLQKVYKDLTNREEEPAALGGGTYAKLMPNTVAFGPNFKEYDGNPHSFDESIDLDMLKQGMEIYAKAIIELGKLI